MNDLTCAGSTSRRRLRQDITLSGDRIGDWSNAKIDSDGHPMPNVIGIGPETAVEPGLDAGRLQGRGILVPG